LPPSSFGEGACPAHVRSRGVESREVGVAVRFTRFGRSRPWCIPLSLRRQEPRRAFLHAPRLSPRVADADPPHVMSTTTLEEPLTKRYRPLTSLVAASGTDHRLQPTHRYPEHHASPCDDPRAWWFHPSASIDSPPAGKGEWSDDARRLKESARNPACLRLQDPAACLIWEDSARDLRTHSPLRRYLPRQSRGFRYRKGNLARARSRTV